MSSGTATPPSLPAEKPVASPTECEIVIDRRLQQTRRHVKSVDIVGGVITLSIGVLAYLLAAAAIDHWLVTGGLGFWGRLALWLVLVGAAGTYFAVKLWRPLVHRINPIFAAATIEKSQPTLKNSLVNFLLLRGHRQEVAPPVYRAMEHRAATDISRVPLETAVDRTHIIRLGCVLLGLLAVSILYLALSPKSPILSARRVLNPWSSVEAPTRVTIRDVQPGDTVAFHGDSVAVSAEVAGLRDGETALLIYSTADGQSVDQTIPLTRSEGAYRYQCRFPPGNLGLQQDCEYYLAAGDYHTRRYRIEAQIAPAIMVDKVSYRYPAYTGIADQVVQRQGDLRAIEGTEVTLYATANTSIKPGSAEIDVGCTGRHGLGMTVTGATAIGRITLRASAKDATGAAYDTYQLRFTDARGRENARPIRYHIDVIRDLPPEVQLTEPPKEEVQVPENGKLTIGVRAEDPDFALRRVTLRAERDGRSLLDALLLDKKKPEKPWPGAFAAAYTLEPAKLGLKVGDRVPYWAEAEDNKEPTAGHAATDRRWITVVASDGPRQPQQKPEAAQGNQAQPNQGQQPHRADPSQRPNDQTSPDQQTPEEPKDASAHKPPTPEAQPPKEGEPDQQRQEASGKDGTKGQSESSQAGQNAGQNGGQADASKPGQEGGQSDSSKPGQDKGQQRNSQQASGDQQGSEPSEKPSERIEPGVNDGDAMQEILKDRQQEQQKQSKTEQSNSDHQQGNQPPSGADNSGDQKSGEQKSGDQKAGDQKSGDQKSGDQKSGDQKSGDQKAGEQKSGDQKAGDQKSGDQKAGDQKSGDQKSGDQKSGDQKAGDQKAGDQKSGDQKAGDQKAGDQKSGDQKSGDQKAGDQKAGDQKSGDQKSGDQKSGDQKAGDQKSGDQKSGDQKAGDQKSGDQKSGDQKSGDQKAGDQKAGDQKAGDQKAGDQKAGDQKAGDQKAGEQQPTAKQSPGAGQKTGDHPGAPAPQGDNRAREKKPGESGSAPGERKGDQPQSPSTSKNQSDSRGDTAGDRSGGGEAGGGQQANQKGIGGPGTHTPADQGGSKADEPGDGDVGTKAGDKAASKRPTGSAAKTPTGKGGGTGEKKPAGGKNATEKPSSPDSSGESGTPQENPANGGTPGQQTSDGPTARGSGDPTADSKSGERPKDAPPPEAVENAADEANIEYSRQQTELALEHLRDQLAKEKPALLERLGWSKEDSRRFLEHWEQMKQSAGQKGPTSEAAKKQFGDALKSLGLRPRGTGLRSGGTPRDKPQNLHDGGHSPTPPDWAEQFREYTRGVADPERK